MNLDELKRKLRSHPNPVIVDLWAPWCIPCRVSKPIMESLAKEYEGRVDFWAINADEHSQLIHELKIFGIPTVLVTCHGEIINKYTGTPSRKDYRALFEALTKTGGRVTVSLSAFDRILRLFAGTVIAIVGVSTSTWLLIPVGGVIAFLGIYDRCPIWRALTSHFSRKAP
jgi:thioredoxin 1